MSNNPLLVVLHVTIGKDSNGDGYGWYAAVPQKVSKVPGVYQMLDITVDMEALTVGFYALPNDVTEDQVEHHLVQSFKYTSSDDLPTQLLAAVQTAIKAEPADNYALKFSGHGGGEGIFDFLLQNNDSFAQPNQITYFLSHVKEAMGTENLLAFLDFSTVCKTASAFNYAAMAPYAKYLIASDLDRTDGYGSGGPVPDQIYDSFWTTTEGKLDLEASLSNLLSAYYTLWSVWEADGGKDLYPQQLSLFQLSNATEDELTMMSAAYNIVYFGQAGYTTEPSQYDVWAVLGAYVKDHPSAASHEVALKATQVMKVDNRESFQWPSPLNEAANGLFYQ